MSISYLPLENFLLHMIFNVTDQEKVLGSPRGRVVKAANL